MTLSLTFDHRVVDGAPAARFLAALRNESKMPPPGSWANRRQSRGGVSFTAFAMSCSVMRQLTMIQRGLDQR